MKYFQGYYPSHSSPKQTPDNFTQESVPLSSSGHFDFIDCDLFILFLIIDFQLIPVRK